MSYEKNPFQKETYESSNNINQTSKNPVYTEPIKRKTIYENVKVNKPIIMYGNKSNNITQNIDYNYNNYDNTVYTKGTEIIDNNNYKDLIYVQTYPQTNTINTTDTYNNYNYDYNYDKTVFTQNTNTNTIDNYTYDTQGNTNYDYNNLIYGQTTNITNTSDINNYNSIMFNQDIGYTDTFNNEQVYVHPVKIIDNTNAKDLYSKPYITTVEEENSNEIIYYPETDQYENKKIEFAKTVKLTNNKNIIYEEKPKKQENNLVKNNETNTNIQANPPIINNVVTNTQIVQPTQKIQPNININNQNIQNSQQAQNKKVVREISKYEKVAQVRKIIEEDVPDDTAYNINNNTVDNNNKIIENLKTNNQIKPKVYDANMKIQHVNQITKIELSPEEDRKANPIYKTMEMQKNNIGVNNNINNDNQINNITAKKEIFNNSNNNINLNENINNRTYNNISYDTNEIKNKNVNMVTPIRRPMDDYKSKARTPLSRGFHKVRIVKKSPEIKKSFFRNDILEKNYTYNNIRYSNKNKKINVVKLNDNNFNTKNVQYNNFKKMSSNNSDRDNIINKIDRKRMSNDSDNNLIKRNEDFNNISEIKYELNNSTDNEQIRREKDNLNFKKREIDFDDDLDNNKNSKNQYNAVIKKIDDDLDNDLKSSNINGKKSGLSESTKRIKNNDGLDEFDNNFNNHDLFYNKMKNLFDD